MADNESATLDPRHHRADVHEATTIRCAVLVVSDSRDHSTDRSGDHIRELLLEEGHSVADRIFVRDEIDAIRQQVLRLSNESGAASGSNEPARPSVDAVVVTGGTGMGRRDVTPEAIEPLLHRRLPGFGEAFRRISYDDIGVRGLFSRAFAGVIGSTAVFALPGSRNACSTAVKALIVPMLPHLIGLIR